MPAGNPLGYITPLLVPPGAGMMGAPAAAVGIDALASLLGVQPTAMSPLAGDMVRQGAAPVQPAMAPSNNTPAARGPQFESPAQWFGQYDRGNPAHQRHLAKMNAANSKNPAWVRGYSDWLRQPAK